MKSLIQTIGDYQIVEKLGRGGMADVYLAVNRKNGRRVALKLVERGEAPDVQEVITAERLGAQLQQRIGHTDPRVPQIHAFGDMDGYFFIEMEFVEGTDLSVLIGNGLRPEEAARIASEVCSVLCTTHTMSLTVDGRELCGIVHGDIKPKNIRIESGGRVRVLDFGIAKGLSITRRLTSSVFASVAYSSPERLETGSIDAMSDLWAVGVVLYEMVQARLPFDAPSTERLEKTIKARTAPRPLRESCPIALQEIIYKALDASPGNRYRDAAQMESDLQAFLTGKETIASREKEQTRRTISLVETRRTVDPPQTAVRKSRIPFLPVLRSLRLPGARKLLLVGILIFLAVACVWEGTVDRTAARLKPEILAGHVDPDTAWSRYEEIKSRSPLGIAPFIVRTPLQELLKRSCERIVNEYRSSDSSRIRERHWMQCRRYMTRAVQLDPSDRKSAAMLEYANGHILRINRKNLDAIAAFQNAASLQPKWPDPYLGMARTYVYNLEDVDRGTQALDRAKELGYRFGRRELAMMAEAHKTRGVKALENADVVQGSDQEEEFLKKAKREFDDALKIYLEISPWGNSSSQVTAVQDLLAEAEQRLNEIRTPNPILPWNWFR